MFSGGKVCGVFPLGLYSAVYNFIMEFQVGFGGVRGEKKGVPATAFQTQDSCD